MKSYIGLYLFLLLSVNIERGQILQAECERLRCKRQSW